MRLEIWADIEVNTEEFSEESIRAHLTEALEQIGEAKTVVVDSHSGRVESLLCSRCSGRGKCRACGGPLTDLRAYAERVVKDLSALMDTSKNDVRRVSVMEAHLVSILAQERRESGPCAGGKDDG